MSERYRKRRPIGVGGMATVYAGVDTETQHPVAIKELKDDDPEFSERFLDEVRAMIKLRHPGIVEILDVERTPPRIIMELAEDGTLAERVEEPMAPQEALRILRQVFGGLAAIHRSGMLHLDIKPSNILLSRGHAKLGDLGVARNLSEDTVRYMTFRYAAPETILRTDLVGPASDLYSLGLVAYELLLGRRVYEEKVWEAIFRAREAEGSAGKSTTSSSGTHTVRSEVPWAEWHTFDLDLPAPHEIAPELSLELSEFVHRLVRKDLTRRTPSCEEALADLDRVLFASSSPSAPTKTVSKSGWQGGWIAAVLGLVLLGLAVHQGGMTIARSQEATLASGLEEVDAEYGEKNLGSAKGLLAKLEQTHGPRAEISYRRGLVNLEAGDPAAAAKAFGRAGEVPGTAPEDVNFLRGYALSQSGHPEAALEALRRYMEASSETSPQRSRAAKLMQALSATAGKVAAVDPSPSPASESLKSQGMASYEAGSFVAAADLLDQHLRQVPEDLEGALVAAKAHYHAGNHGRSQRLLRRLEAEGWPGYEVPYFLGLIELQKERWAVAVDELRRAERLSRGENTEVGFYLGYAHYNLEQTQQARQAFRSYLASSSPRPENVERARQFLRSMDG